MAIPRVGIVDGRVVVEGGGVRFDAPISDAPSAPPPVITVGGQRFRSGRRTGGGLGGGFCWAMSHLHCRSLPRQHYLDNQPPV